MKKDITHIFFDLDHTLWDFDTNSALAFDKIFKKDHATINTTAFLEKYIPINQACWKLYQVDKMSHDELRYQRLKQSFDAINYAISDAQIDQVAHEYIQLLPEFNPLLTQKSVAKKINMCKIFSFLTSLNSKKNFLKRVQKQSFELLRWNYT